MEPMVIAALISAGSSILGGLTGGKGGGAGGATSAQVQGGQTGLQYQDVAGTGITPFEFEEMQRQFDEEQQLAEAMAEAQGQRSGGPLFAADGNSIDFKTQIAQDIFGQGIKDLMPQGILGILLAKHYLDNVDDEEEESIVPMPANMGRPLYANEGLEIEDYFPDIEFDPTAISSEVVSYDEKTGQPRTEETSLTDPLTGEEFGQQTGDELEEILGRQEIRDTIAQEGIGLLTKLLTSEIKARNTSPSISPRRPVTPLPGKGGGGRAARQERQREGTSGITPFTYQPVADGGVLGRSMFAQNYMPQGGAMQGPGGPKDDLIPVMASDGEYMLSKAAVDQAGGGNHARGIANLEQFNNMGNRRYG
jgi:hypothetical protein